MALILFQFHIVKAIVLHCSGSINRRSHCNDDVSSIDLNKSLDFKNWCFYFNPTVYISKFHFGIIFS